MQIDFRQDFIDLGFKERGKSANVWSIEINDTTTMVCHFRNDSWSVENWLTIEFEQGTKKLKNKFIKFNNFVTTKEELLLIVNLIMKTNKKLIRG